MAKTYDTYKDSGNAWIALVDDVRSIINAGRQTAYSAVNSAMVETYWRIGQRIVEEEQKGQQRAEYGKQIIKQLSVALTHEYGKGFSARYLAYFRKFYLTVPDIKILQTRLQNLHWSHIHRILSVDNEVAARWYLTTASQEMWSVEKLSSRRNCLNFNTKK
ncbi:MAG: DUF1016 N-terminal domain-containing protein [Bacteroides sp.]